TEGVLIAILLAWSRHGENPKSDFAPRPSPLALRLLVTWLAFTLCVWMHGLWYMWVLALAAFFLSGLWRSAFWLTVCWLGGTITGALLTGHPFGFLKQALFIASPLSHQNVQQWILVGELRPNYGEFSTLALVALVFLWRKQRSGAVSRFCSRPALWLIALGWILGLKADRFWADWGIPAVMVWLTIQFEEMDFSFWDL